MFDVGFDVSSPQAVTAVACVGGVLLLLSRLWVPHAAPLIAAWRGHKVSVLMEDIEKDPLEYMAQVSAGFVVPVVIIDTEGLVRIFNGPAEELTGWRSEEIVGASISLLMPEPHKGFHHHYVTKYLEERDAGERPALSGAGRIIDLLHREGRKIPCRIFVTEYRNGTRGFWAWLHPLQSEEN